MKNNLALYIHYPYCIRKCPYCDFNSHAISGASNDFDEQYLKALLTEFKLFIPYIDDRKIISIFIGGGTPSLASISFIDKLLAYFMPYLASNAEITMEANPGTIESDKLASFYQSGINRLSLGVQSFNDDTLKKLGRIHNAKEAHFALEKAFKVGFSNINVDIMHGIMGQDVDLAMYDLKQALSYDITHLSWYELTIEEDTYFGLHTPTLPTEDILADIEQTGFALLDSYSFERYEVSAFTKNKHYCVHNKNYWLYGDYIGLGAGAHSKLSFANQILRKANIQEPNAYIKSCQHNNLYKVADNDIAFEYMLNRLRLFEPISIEHYFQTTAQSFDKIRSKIEQAIELELMVLTDKYYYLTTKGKLMLNDVLELFLE